MKREVETEKRKRGLTRLGKDCIRWREDGEVLSLWDQNLGSVLEGERHGYHADIGEHLGGVGYDIAGGRGGERERRI